MIRKDEEGRQPSTLFMRIATVVHHTEYVQSVRDQSSTGSRHLRGVRFSPIEVLREAVAGGELVMLTRRIPSAGVPLSATRPILVAGPGGRCSPVTPHARPTLPASVPEHAPRARRRIGRVILQSVSNVTRSVPSRNDNRVRQCVI